MIALTDSHVAHVHREVPDQGPVEGFRLMGDDEIGAEVERLLSERPAGPLHVFAYGSLLWNPVFTPIRKRRALARGWHREFCIEMRTFRATPEAPGLMLGLMSGGRCTGLAFEVGEAEVEAATEALIRREMPYAELVGNRRWIALETEDGPITALVFYAGPTGPRIRRRIPLEEAASMFAEACGPRGSAVEYLLHTVRALDAAGLSDRNLWRLQHLVAEEIDRRRT